MLLTSLSCTGQTHLIVGSGPLANDRAKKSAEAGASKIIIFSHNKIEEDGSTELCDKESLIIHIDREFEIADLTSLGRPEVDNVVDLVFLTLAPTDTMAIDISKVCRRLRIPVNVTDSRDLSTFALLSTYTDGPLHIGVSTSGSGCRLANRIKRHIVGSLPANISRACTNVGSLRQQIRSIDKAKAEEQEQEQVRIGQEEDDAIQAADFNQLIIAQDEYADDLKRKRMRWLSQIVEYYPLESLGEISIDDLSDTYEDLKKSPSPTIGSKKGKMLLVGSGPGDPKLLTTAAVEAISEADLVLADKLVPSGVLDLIPRRTEVFIAKKFPGNADAAQDQLQQMGLDALAEGKTVVRLKQGDPYIFGRGAEEVLFFASHGYHAQVIPGISSALAAPLAANIPPTHRDVADQVLVCTGVGRKGAIPKIPEYISSRTTIFLMSLNRIDNLIDSLIANSYPPDLPCAVVERATCHDERTIYSTLKYVVEAVQTLGSRPPGLFIVGFSCQVIVKLSPGEKYEVIGN